MVVSRLSATTETVNVLRQAIPEPSVFDGQYIKIGDTQAERDWQTFKDRECLSPAFWNK